MRFPITRPISFLLLFSFVVTSAAPAAAGPELSRRTLRQTGLEENPELRARLEQELMTSQETVVSADPAAVPNLIARFTHALGLSENGSPPPALDPSGWGPSEPVPNPQAIPHNFPLDRHNFSGLEAWGGPLALQLLVKKHSSRQSHSLMIQDRTLEDSGGPVFWVDPLKVEMENRARVGFRVYDHAGKPAPEEGIVLRAGILQKILDQEGGPPWEGVHLRRGDATRNPAVIAFLNSPRVKGELRLEKEKLTRKKENGQISGEGRLVLTLSRGGESAVLFDTSGDDPEQWRAVAHVGIRAALGNKVSFGVSAPGSIAIYRDHIAPRPDPDPAAATVSSAIPRRRAPLRRQWFQSGLEGGEVLAVSPDGFFSAVRAPDGKILLEAENMGGGKDVISHLHRGSTKGIRTAVFSPDSKRLATGSDDGLIRIWHARSGRLARDGVLDQWSNSASITALAYRPDGKMLASGDESGRVRIWDPTGKGNAARASQLLPTKVTALAFNPAGDLLAAGDAAGTTRLIPPAQVPLPANILKVFQGASPVEAVGFRTDGNEVAVATADGNLTVWNVNGTPAFRSRAGKSFVETGTYRTNTGERYSRDYQLSSLYFSGLEAEPVPSIYGLNLNGVLNELRRLNPAYIRLTPPSEKPEDKPYEFSSDRSGTAITKLAAVFGIDIGYDWDRLDFNLISLADDGSRVSVIARKLGKDRLILAGGPASGLETALMAEELMAGIQEQRIQSVEIGGHSYTASHLSTVVLSNFLARMARIIGPRVKIAPSWSVDSENQRILDLRISGIRELKLQARRGQTVQGDEFSYRELVLQPDEALNELARLFGLREGVPLTAVWREDSPDSEPANVFALTDGESAAILQGSGGSGLYPRNSYTFFRTDYAPKRWGSGWIKPILVAADRGIVRLRLEIPAERQERFSVRANIGFSSNPWMTSYFMGWKNSPFRLMETDGVPAPSGLETLKQEGEQAILERKGMAIITVKTVEQALNAGRAVAAKGLIPEITFRPSEGVTEEMVVEVIRTLAGELQPKGIPVAAGSVLTEEQVAKAVAAGAAIIVSPGFDEEVVKKALELEVLPVPGVGDPIEALKARKMGLRLVKFFPIHFKGVDGMKKTLQAPMPADRRSVWNRFIDLLDPQTSARAVAGSPIITFTRADRHLREMNPPNLQYHLPALQGIQAIAAMIETELELADLQFIVTGGVEPEEVPSLIGRRGIAAVGISVSGNTGEVAAKVSKIAGALAQVRSQQGAPYHVRELATGIKITQQPVLSADGKFVTVRHSEDEASVIEIATGQSRSLSPDEVGALKGGDKIAGALPLKLQGERTEISAEPTGLVRKSLINGETASIGGLKNPRLAVELVDGRLMVADDAGLVPVNFQTGVTGTRIRLDSQARWLLPMGAEGGRLLAAGSDKLWLAERAKSSAGLEIDGPAPLLKRLFIIGRDQEKLQELAQAVGEIRPDLREREGGIRSVSLSMDQMTLSDFISRLRQPGTGALVVGESGEGRAADVSMAIHIFDNLQTPHLRIAPPYSGPALRTHVAAIEGMLRAAPEPPPLFSAGRSDENVLPDEYLGAGLEADSPAGRPIQWEAVGQNEAVEWIDKLWNRGSGSLKSISGPNAWLNGEIFSRTRIVRAVMSASREGDHTLALGFDESASTVYLGTPYRKGDRLLHPFGGTLVYTVEEDQADPNEPIWVSAGRMRTRMDPAALRANYTLQTLQPSSPTVFTGDHYAGLETTAAVAPGPHYGTRYMAANKNPFFIDATDKVGPGFVDSSLGRAAAGGTYNPASVGTATAAGALDALFSQVDTANLDGWPLAWVLQQRLVVEDLKRMELSIELDPTVTSLFQLVLDDKGKLQVLKAAGGLLLKEKFARSLGQGPTLPVEPAQPLDRPTARSIGQMMVREWIEQALGIARLGEEALGRTGAQIGVTKNLGGNATVKIGNTASLAPWLGEEEARRVGEQVFHALAVLGISRNFTLGFTEEDADRTIAANWVTPFELMAIQDERLDTLTAQRVLGLLFAAGSRAEQQRSQGQVQPGEGRAYHSHFISRLGARIQEEGPWKQQLSEKARTWFDLVQSLHILITRFNDEFSANIKHGVRMIPASLEPKAKGLDLDHYLLHFWGAGEQVVPTAALKVAEAFNARVEQGNWTEERLSELCSAMASTKDDYAEETAGEADPVMLSLSATDHISDLLFKVQKLTGGAGFADEEEAMQVVSEILRYPMEHPNSYLQLMKPLYPEGDVKFQTPHLKGVGQVVIRKAQNGSLDFGELLDALDRAEAEEPRALSLHFYRLAPDGSRIRVPYKTEPPMNFPPADEGETPMLLSEGATPWTRDWIGKGGLQALDWRENFPVAGVQTRYRLEPAGNVPGFDLPGVNVLVLAPLPAPAAAAPAAAPTSGLEADEVVEAGLITKSTELRAGDIVYEPNGNFLQQIQEVGRQGISFSVQLAQFSPGSWVPLRHLEDQGFYFRRGVTPVVNAASAQVGLDDQDYPDYWQMAGLETMSSWRELAGHSPRLFDLLVKELNRQQQDLNLTASESYAPDWVLAPGAHPASNKYLEGYPGQRYYQGGEVLDQLESEAQALWLKVAGTVYRPLSGSVGEEYSVNVQPHSGSDANQAVYFSVLRPGDKVAGLALSHGGHLTHGFRYNFSGKNYEGIPIYVDLKTGIVDYDRLERDLLALPPQDRPRLMILGGTAVVQPIDWVTLRLIADRVTTANFAAGHRARLLLVADISHNLAQILARDYPSPFGHADFVTTTTHKSRGARGGLVYSRNDRSYFDVNEHAGVAPEKLNTATLADLLDQAVIPGIQGGPDLSKIATKYALADWMLTDEFRAYARQIRPNAKALAQALQQQDPRVKLIGGGTDTHLMLLDTRPFGLTGQKASKALESVGIILNANSLPVDPEEERQWDPSLRQKGKRPAGIRIGVPAPTARGMKEADMTEIARLVLLTLQNTDPKTAKVGPIASEISSQVRQLTSRFPVYEEMRSELRQIQMAASDESVEDAEIMGTSSGLEQAAPQVPPAQLPARILLAADPAAGVALQKIGVEAFVVAQTPTDAAQLLEAGVEAGNLLGLAWAGLELADYQQAHPSITRVAPFSPIDSGWERKLSAWLTRQTGLEVLLVTGQASLASGLEQLGADDSTIREVLQTYADAEELFRVGV